MAVQPQELSVERRKVSRQKSFLRGAINFNNRQSVLDCLIRDISPHGARLIFSGAVAVPDVLELYIPQKDQTLRAHVISRHGREIRVAFAQHLALDGLTEEGDLGERVQRLEAEVAALKRLLRQIKAGALHELATE
jgi:hypothetical protein